MMRARWSFADDAILNDDALECLLKAVTRRYPSVCWVSSWEDPDTLTAKSGLYWRGTVRRYTVPQKEYRRIVFSIYRQVGKPIDTTEDMNDGAVDSLVDDALVDAAEAVWDHEIERLLRPQRQKGRAGSRRCATIEMIV
jgi:hypothetical protein